MRSYDNCRTHRRYHSPQRHYALTSSSWWPSSPTIITTRFDQWRAIRLIGPQSLRSIGERINCHWQKYQNVTVVGTVIHQQAIIQFLSDNLLLRFFEFIIIRIGTLNFDNTSTYACMYYFKHRIYYCLDIFNFNF